MNNHIIALVAASMLGLAPGAHAQDTEDPAETDDASSGQKAESASRRGGRHHQDRHHGRRHDGGKNRQRPAFSDFDQDDDGAISNDEFNAFHAARIQQRSAEGRKMKNVANASRFNEIDSDEDGRIDPDEFAAHQSAERGAKRRQ